MLIENPDEFARWELLDKGNSKYPKVTLSPNYTLESLRKRVGGQVSISRFLDTEPACDVMGSCFL
jgi:hypothetical protein